MAISATPLATVRKKSSRSQAHSVPIGLEDGQQTTVHIAVFPRQSFQLRVAVFPEAERLLPWCRQRGVAHAMTGGFFSRRDKMPLGEVWMRGVQVDSINFGKQWAGRRGAIQSIDERLRIAPLEEINLPPEGDLMTSSPILVKGGEVVAHRDSDFEGIPETWEGELDDDWTQLRAQRTAVGFNEDTIWAIACDGQSSQAWKGFHDPDNTEAGLYLWELAEVFVALGATSALNMDGGGGSTLVYDSKLLNRPLAGRYDPEPNGAVLRSGRPIHTALTFLPR